MDPATAKTAAQSLDINIHDQSKYIDPSDPQWAKAAENLKSITSEHEETLKGLTPAHAERFQNLSPDAVKFARESLHGYKAEQILWLTSPERERSRENDALVKFRDTLTDRGLGAEHTDKLILPWVHGRISFDEYYEKTTVWLGEKAPDLVTDFKAAVEGKKEK